MEISRKGYKTNSEQKFGSHLHATVHIYMLQKTLWRLIKRLAECVASRTCDGYATCLFICWPDVMEKASQTLFRSPKGGWRSVSKRMQMSKSTVEERIVLT
jgi:hypothetical protein